MSDEFNEEDEWDYSDEKSVGDEFGDFLAESNIQTVYRDWERVGIAEDDDWDLPIGEDIKMDADLKFKLDLKTILDENRFGFTKADISNIKKVVRHLPFIQHKNPLLLALGYYFYQYIRGQPRPDYKFIDEYIASERSFTRYEVIRYARYWQIQLRNKIDFN